MKIFSPFILYMRRCIMPSRDLYQTYSIPCTCAAATCVAAENCMWTYRFTKVIANVRQTEHIFHAACSAQCSCKWQFSMPVTLYMTVQQTNSSGYCLQPVATMHTEATTEAHQYNLSHSSNHIDFKQDIIVTKD